MPKLLMIKLCFIVLLVIVLSCKKEPSNQEGIFVDLLRTIINEYPEGKTIQIDSCVNNKLLKCICINQTLHVIHEDEWPMVKDQWENATGLALDVSDSIKLTIDWNNLVSDIEVISVDSCLVKNKLKCTAVNISRAYLDGNKGVGLIYYKVMKHPENGYEGIAVLEKKRGGWFISSHIPTAVY